MFQVECPAHGDPSTKDDQLRPEYPAGIELLSIGFEKLLKSSNTLVPDGNVTALLGSTTSALVVEVAAGVLVGVLVANGVAVGVRVGVLVAAVVAVGVRVGVLAGVEVLVGAPVGAPVGVGDAAALASTKRRSSKA